MAKTIPISLAVEKNKLSSDKAFLLLLDLEVVNPADGSSVETLYVVKNNESVTYQGHLYTAANFNFEIKQEAGALPTVQLVIIDFARAIQEQMQMYGGGVGFRVTLTVVNSGALTEPPEIREYFEVVGATSADYVASFTLGAESGLARIFPRRRQMRNYCSWKYKGVECGYVGAIASCDLTLAGVNGCGAHNNTLRYGGFPGINPRNGNFG